MKIIVSTFALKNFLNIAITRKYKNLTIAAETNQLQVTNKNPNGHGPILDFYLVPSSDSKINSYFKIDEIQLYDMVLFLNQLEEQPMGRV